MQRISSGSRQVDAILNGGFPENSINIIMGQPGTGKTLFAEQLCFANAGDDRPVLYLSTFSEPLAKMITYLQEYSFADPARLGTSIVFENFATDLLARPEKHDERMLGLIQEHRPRVIVIDSFKALSDLTPDRTDWRHTVFELAGLLSAYGTTSFWVGEYTSEMTAQLPEFAIADSILELTREQRGSRDDRYLRVVKLRGSGFLDGYHSLRITSSGIEVFPRLVSPAVSPDYQPIYERLANGILGLDGMIEAGWLRGTTTLVAGPSGAGKTVLGLHFLREGVRQGEPGLLVNFQENPTQLARVMDRFGWETGALVGPGKLDIFHTSPVDLQIDTIVREMFRRIESQGVRRVVIDALGDLEMGARDSARFRDYLYSLTQLFASSNLTAMLLLETSSPLHAVEMTGMDISYMSDNILLLGRRLDSEGGRTISVVKSRGSAHDSRQHVLEITPQGIVVELSAVR